MAAVPNAGSPMFPTPLMTCGPIECIAGSNIGAGGGANPDPAPAMGFWYVGGGEPWNPGLIC